MMGMSKLIIVGVDGSDDSIAALRWAVDLAESICATVRAVHVWTPLPGHGITKKNRHTLESRRARRESDAEAVLREVVGGVEIESANVEQQVVEGNPGPALVDLSRNSDLLVVGAAGRSTNALVRRPPLGSCARYATRHAMCPATVIRSSHVPKKESPPRQCPATTVHLPPTRRRRNQDAHAELGWGPL
jgi:nucleotide-binding universal stress UspA family protein